MALLCPRFPKGLAKAGMHPFYPADFAAWIPARRVRARSGPVAAGHAASNLLRRRPGGLPAARAETFIVISGRPKRFAPERLVPAYLWQAIASRDQLDSLSLWSTGTAEVDIF